jgi:hypothetical protein
MKKTMSYEVLDLASEIEPSSPEIPDKAPEMDPSVRVERGFDGEASGAGFQRPERETTEELRKQLNYLARRSLGQGTITEGTS